MQTTDKARGRFWFADWKMGRAVVGGIPKPLSCFLACMAVIAFTAGCYSTYTPEEIAAQLKKQTPVPERLPVGSESRGAAALLGEWEGSQSELHAFYWQGEVTETHSYVYQFFDDSSFNCVHSISAPNYRHSVTSHGSWRYADGKLEMFTYKDGIMQRELPLKLFWRSDTAVEVRYDSLLQEQNKNIQAYPGKTYKYVSKYDEDGFWLRFTDRESHDMRMMAAHARSPLILNRVGDAMRPPSGVTMQNPVVESKQTTVSLEAIRLQQQAAESFSRAGVELTKGIGDAMAVRAAPVSNATTPLSVPSESTQEGSTVSKTSAKQVAKVSSKRKCNRHGVEYDLRTGCPQCKAPQFGLDWEVKCNNCGYWHISGKPCPHCN